MSCLSKSLKVIRTDTDWSATYDFLFMFGSTATMGLFRTVSKINADFSQNRKFFPTPVYLTAEWVPLGTGYRRFEWKN